MTRVLSEQIDGDRISTTSPGCRKRSGAEVLSANNSLEIRSGTCCRSAADNISWIKRKVARQIFEILTEREDHIARVKTLAALPVDQCLQIDIRRINFAYHDTRPHRV